MVKSVRKNRGITKNISKGLKKSSPSGGAFCNLLSNFYNLLVACAILFVLTKFLAFNLFGLIFLFFLADV